MSSKRSLKNLTPDECVTEFCTMSMANAQEAFRAAYLKGMHSVQKNVQSKGNLFVVYEELKLHYKDASDLFKEKSGNIEVDGEFNPAEYDAPSSVENLSYELGYDDANDLHQLIESESKYHEKFEGAYSSAVNAYEKAYADALEGDYYDEQCERLVEGLILVSPNNLGLVLNAVFNELFSDERIIPIALRHIAGDFFTALSRYHSNWATKIHLIKSRLDIGAQKNSVPIRKKPKPKAKASPKPNKSAINISKRLVKDTDADVHTYINRDTNKDMIGVEKAACKPGLTVDNSGNLGKIIKFSKDGSLRLQDGVDQALSDHFGGTLTQLDFATLDEETRVNSLALKKVQRLLVKIQNDKRLVANGGDWDIHSALKDALSGLSGDRYIAIIEQAYENIINLMAYLFECITGNQDLISEVKQEIQKAQVPMTRLALSDPSIFQSIENPARKYLDNLGKLGLRISSVDESGYVFLAQSITLLVQNESQTLETYKQSNNALAIFLRESNYKSNETVVDTQEEIESSAEAISSNKVEQFLDAEENKLSKELNFHKFLRLLWFAILSKIVADNKYHEEEWETATSVYKKLLWTTQLDTSEESKREVLRNIPKVVNSIKSLFATYNINDSIRETLFDHMFKIHVVIVKGDGIESISDDVGITDSFFNTNTFAPRALADKPKEKTDLISSQAKADKTTTDANSNSKITPAKTSSTSKPKTTKTTTIEPDQSLPSSDMHTNDTSQVMPSNTMPKSGGMSFDVSSIPDSLENDDLKDEKTDIEKTNFEKTRTPAIKEPEVKNNMASASKIIEAFKSGDLYQIMINGTQKRYELVHMSNVLGKFTFQEFGAPTIIELTKAELVLDIMAGNVKSIEKTSVFDSALESIVSDLRTDKSSQAKTSETKEDNKTKEGGRTITQLPRTRGRST